MTKPQVEVIATVRRRRRWSRGVKGLNVAAAMGPGAVASEVFGSLTYPSAGLGRRPGPLLDRSVKHLALELARKTLRLRINTTDLPCGPRPMPTPNQHLITLHRVRV
jgi:hypothetical protein